MFAGIGVLLSVRSALSISQLASNDISVCQTAQQVKASYDALVDIFECIENFLRRLRIYTEIPSNPAMTEVIIKIMLELLRVLALATKQMNQGRFSEVVLAVNHLWLDLLQRNMERNYWAKKSSNRCCRGSIDSPSMSRGRRLYRLLTLYMV